MATTREEVITTLGVDSSSIERGLGIGKNYFQDYLNWQKTEEGKYSNWWNTELKKREEMEIAASVRAASRSIQARRLLRERETARNLAADAEQAAANTVISGGSVPAGWAERAAAMKAGKELEMKAAEALKDAAGGAHGSAGAMRELMVVVRELARGDMTRLPGSLSRLLGMIGLSTSSIIGIGAAAAEAGAVIYEVYQTRKAVKEEEASQGRMDTGAKIMAGRLKTEIANFEKAGKLSHETAAKYEKILQSPTLERNRIVQDALRKQFGSTITKHDAEAEARADEEHNKNIVRNAKEAMSADERFIMSGTKMMILKEEMSKLDRTSLEYKQKQLEYDAAQLEHTESQKQVLQQNADIMAKINSAQEIYNNAKDRLAHREERERDKFLPTLEELAHHGRFGSQARGIGRLDRRIKREIERGDIGGADHDIAARNKLYDALADRGVAAQRADRFEVKELAVKMQKALQEIADGKAAIKIVPQLK